MLTKTCLVCKRKFVKPYYCSRKSWKIRKYCSLRCSAIATKNGFQKGHSVCGGFKTRFKKGSAGKKCVNWGGGRSYYRNRWFIRKPNHPFVCQNGCVRLSRLVAEKYLNRYLTPKEVIHHINGIKDDDRPENLYLFATSGKHSQYHSMKNKPKLISNLP